MDEVAIGRLEGRLQAVLEQQTEFRRETNAHFVAVQLRLDAHTTELAETRGEKGAHRRLTALIAALVSGLITGLITFLRYMVSGHP